jgi:hypothetical protein
MAAAQPVTASFLISVSVAATLSFNARLRFDEALMNKSGYGSGISSDLQIFRASRSGISLCRGTGSRRPVSGFQ